MKISNQQINEALRAYRRELQEIDVSPTKKEREGTEKDRVELSIDRAELEELVAKAREIPEVRAERVDELKKKVRDGTYRVAARDIAEKLLGRNIVDNLE